MEEELILMGKCVGSVKNIKKEEDKKNKAIKYLWKVSGQNQGIESGYFFGIDYGDRHCITVSTEQGCFLSKLGKPCKFCITGQQKYFGKLTSKQILKQILYVAMDNEVKKKGGAIEVAFMGMGEPGMNYSEVSKSMEILEKILPKIGLKSKRYIFSTIGVPTSIKKLGKDIAKKRFGNAKVRLHLSLHAHTDEMRNEIVPANKIYPIKSVMAAAKNYIKNIEKVKNSDKKISINYMMFNKFKPKQDLVFTNITK